MRESKLLRAKAENFLNRLTREGSEVITHAEWVRRRIAEGYTPRIKMVDKIQPMSRRAFFRADQQAQDAHERRVREAGQKAEYSIWNTIGKGYVISKFEYDYAQQLRGERT